MCLTNNYIQGKIWLNLLEWPTTRVRKYDRSKDPRDTLSDLELYKEYRLDKEAIIYVTAMVKDDLPEIQDQRGLPLKPHIVVMAALLCLASNAYQIRIGRSFNSAQKKTRVAIECAISILKQRFGILHLQIFRIHQ